jgi:acid stress chaperone HdeA
MNKITLVAIGISALMATSARADKPDAATAKPAKPDAAAKTGKTPATSDKTAKSDKMAKGPSPAKMTCEDFVMLEDVAKPKVVYWAEGFDRKGKPEDATFDIEATDRLVPVLVEICKQTPKESFWKKAKAEFKKIF